MLFLTLEDEEGLVNLVVRPDIYERYRQVLRNAPLLWAEGRLQQEGQAVSILVQRAAVLRRIPAESFIRSHSQCQDGSAFE
jgi:error-prone DNA polymerase